MNRASYCAEQIAQMIAAVQHRDMFDQPTGGVYEIAGVNLVQQSVPKKLLTQIKGQFEMGIWWADRNVDLTVFDMITLVS